MILHYSDHAANERTFLAWIRTAVAVAAFGVVVEKFDPFLAVAARTTGAPAPSRLGDGIAHVTGLLIIVLAGVIMALAAVRFRRTAAAIDREGTEHASGIGLELVLVALLMLFGAALFVDVAVSVAQQP